LFTIKRMKKIFALTLFLSFFFLAVFPVRALTATPASEKQEKRIEKLQDRVATVEAKLNVRKKEIIRNHFLRMTKRLEAAINRLNRLITRIESRIAKIEANNEDIKTEPIKKDIQKAKDKLLLATNKLNEAKIKIDGLLESSSPKETFTEMKNMIQEIKKDLIEVHRLLVKVIGDIKGLRVGNSATPSAETE